jgi:uncharacterized protein with NRDE domain
MCTVTILARPRGFCITMNRDERRTRAAEYAPAPWGDNGLIAPRDPVGGGTWIGLNPRGQWACIMNSYVAHTPTRDDTSRGEIIPLLLAQGDPSAALATLDVAAYRPFRLILGTRTHWQLYHSNGQSLTVEARSEGRDVMFSSSSWNADAVLPARNAAFARWQAHGSAVDAQGIPTIHRWQEAGDEKTAILMQRPESATTSITQINFADESNTPTMHYWPANELAPMGSL